MWTSSDFSRCSLPVPDVTISLIIITDGEGQTHWSRTNEKHARIRSVPELGTRDGAKVIKDGRHERRVGRSETANVWNARGETEREREAY